jgi:hypothetical protein
MTQLIANSLNPSGYKIKRVGVRTIYRDPKAINSFNQKGITLSTIEAELRAAYTDLSVDPQNMVPFHFDYPGGLGHFEANGGHGLNKRVSMLDIEEACIRRNDDYLAEMIRKNPVAMLCDDRVQSAVARWCYADWHGGMKSETRNKCRLLLKKIRTANRGAPTQYSLYSEQLKQCYDDLVDYSKGLRHSYRSKGIDAMKTYFPDCKRLSDLGLGFVTLDDHYFIKHGLPAPGAVAEAFIERVIGIQKSSLHHRIDHLSSH